MGSCRPKDVKFVVKASSCKNEMPKTTIYFSQHVLTQNCRPAGWSLKKEGTPIAAHPNRFFCCKIYQLDCCSFQGPYDLRSVVGSFVQQFASQASKFSCSQCHRKPPRRQWTDQCFAETMICAERRKWKTLDIWSCELCLFRYLEEELKRESNFLMLLEAATMDLHISEQRVLNWRIFLETGVEARITMASVLRQRFGACRRNLLPACFQHPVHPPSAITKRFMGGHGGDDAGNWIW